MNTRRICLFVLVLLVLLPLSAHAAAKKSVKKVVNTAGITKSLVSFGHQSAVDRTVDTIIVHSTYNPVLKTQTFAGALALWKKTRTAPHYAIAPSGKVYQLVDEKNVAYQAGAGTLPNGEGNINNRSIGIELIYNRNSSPSAKQYAALKTLLEAIEKRHTVVYVLGHNEIAPDRKVDPWNFDWKKIDRPQGPLVIAPFVSTVKEIDSNESSAMTGSSWHEGCPVAIADLRSVSVTYHGFDGKAHQGEIIVHKSVATDTVAVFKKLYEATFAIRQMQPVDVYHGDDIASMNADNTSGFNCRNSTDSTALSQHAYGLAIDINPKENPYVDTSLPQSAQQNPTIVRDPMVPGTINDNDTVVQAFKSIGWKWGGSWASKKDFQHFSQNGK